MFIYINWEPFIFLFIAITTLIAAISFGGEIIERHVRSTDGVDIVYTVVGDGNTTLILIHGGLADRSFWDEQIAILSEHYRVVAVDLAGHGASGCNRKVWTIAAFGEDVRAVADTMNLSRIVLVGNSLGGAVALNASSLLKGRIIAVVGVDTFQNATRKIEPSEAKATADAFRNDFIGTCRKMAKSLFHKDEQENLLAWAEARMLKTPPEVAIGMMEGTAGYDTAKAFRAASVPIRAINGDLFPTKTDSNRSVVQDFEVVIMKGAGHYPMLERPEEFNQHLIKLIKSLDNKVK